MFYIRQKHFCFNKQVLQVHSSRPELLYYLEKDVSQYLHGNFSDFGRSDLTTDDYYGEWWSSFIDLVCHLPYLDNCRQTLVAKLSEYYQGKEAELRALREFESDYSPAKAIFWYTRPTFLFRLLNRALRQHNIELTFLFGFFVRDLCCQIQAEHKKNATEPVIHVYRGQIMSLDEIEELKHGYVRETKLNSFLSTSRNPDVALMFLESMSSTADGFAPVLWKIELDIRHESCFFADVSRLSSVSEESEIILRIGTCLHVDEIIFSENERVYKMKLRLANDNVLKIKDEYTDTTLRRTLKKCTLAIRKKLDFAAYHDLNAIFNEFALLYPSEKYWLEAERYYCLGQHHTNDYVKDILNYQRAIDLWQQYRPVEYELNCADQIANIHWRIGTIYRDRLKDDRLSMKHFILSVNICETALETAKNDREKAELYASIASVYLGKEGSIKLEKIEREKRVTGLRYKELELLHYPPDDEKVGCCMKVIADIRRSLGQFDEALANYEKAAHIFRVITDYRQLADVYRSMVTIHREEKDDLVAVLRCQLLDHEITLKVNVVQSFDSASVVMFRQQMVAHSHVELAETYANVQEPALAREHLIAAKKIYLERDADDSKNITLSKRLQVVEETLLDMDRSSEKHSISVAERLEICTSPSSK